MAIQQIGVKQYIFKNDRDKEKLLEHLGNATERFSTLNHSWSLMNNHYHLPVETSEPESSLGFRECCGITAEDIKVRRQ